MIQSLVLALSLFTFVNAQDSNVPLEIEAIQAHFQNAGLVPDLLANFTPVAAMSVSFDGVGVIQPGQALSIDRERLFIPRMTQNLLTGGTFQRWHLLRP